MRDCIDELQLFREEFEEGVASGQIQEIPLSNTDARPIAKALEKMPPVITPESAAEAEFEASKQRLVEFMQVVMIESDFSAFNDN